MSITTDLPSDHQYEVLTEVIARGNGTVLRFSDTSIATLRAMARRRWVTIQEAAVIGPDGEPTTRIVGATMTHAGCTAYIRAQQHRANLAREAAAEERIAAGAAPVGAVTGRDPFAAFAPVADLPF